MSGFGLPVVNQSSAPMGSKPLPKGATQGTVAILTQPGNLNNPNAKKVFYEENSEQFIEEYERELIRIKEENAQLRYQKELSERNYQNVMMENTGLMSKLENLENIFVGAPIHKPSAGTPSIESDKYTISKVISVVSHYVA